MALEKSLAKEKLWKFPELVERLASMLDPRSVLYLIQSSVVDKDILQKSLSSKAWSRLIKHSSYDEGKLQREDVRDMIRVLRFLEPEEPSAFLLPLLHEICKSRPSYQTLNPHLNVQLVCPSCHPDPHSITLEAFLMLEEVEGAFGTAEQSVKSISCWDVQEPMLSALSSRVSRQAEPLASVRFTGLTWICESIDTSSVDALSLLLLKAERVYVKNMCMPTLGEEGLHTLARSLQGKPDLLLERVNISTKDLTEASRDDIKVLWETTRLAIGVFNPEFGDFACGARKELYIYKAKYDWPHVWTKMKQMSEMTEEEFTAEHVPACLLGEEEEEEYEEDVGDVGGEEGA